MTERVRIWFLFKAPWLLLFRLLALPHEIARSAQMGFIAGPEGRAATSPLRSLRSKPNVDEPTTGYPAHPVQSVDADIVAVRRAQMPLGYVHPNEHDEDKLAELPSSPHLIESVCLSVRAKMLAIEASTELDPLKRELLLAESSLLALRSVQIADLGNSLHERRQGSSDASG